MQADLLSYSFVMFDYNISPYESMLTIRLHNAVTEADILLLIPKVDEYLEHHKRLAGIMLISKDWAGWESFAALRATMTFLSGHHNKISRIALVTNSVLADLMKDRSDFWITKADYEERGMAVLGRDVTRGPGH